jgi:hypothetical protein
MPDYQNLSRDELLNLTQSRDQLTDEARFALDAELASRQVNVEEVRSYARETVAQERAKERRMERSKFSHQGRNKRFLGKKNRHHDPKRRIEEFDTTLWFMLGIPLVPLASYRIRRRFRRWWTLCPSTKLHILETRPRDWEQILLTWGKNAAVLVALFLLVVNLDRR